MTRTAPASILLAVWLAAGSLVGADQPPVDFNREIRPILAEHCIKCHGPDAEDRQAGLRLDTRPGAFSRLESDAFAVVPGKSQQSELYRRVSATNADERMPPAEFPSPLQPEQIELLRRWIDEGAKWNDHWAYESPQRPALPPVRRTDWPVNAIDYFTLAAMENHGFEPSPEADRERLIRRVTLALTGLPPTLNEIDAFLADRAPNAYEQVVDRLLQSPRYGERMAVPWLDLARYADTHGYHTDSHRDMWRWREWVINALNDNLPFDQFTIEQLAGDLLPHATLEQRIASGFNRNNMVNFEAGAIPEEYRTEYVVDRVVTTSTVWLGQTMLCARCHDHKYDPFTQRDFYRMFAYFNNVPEEGLDGQKGNAVPFIAAPTRSQQREFDRLDGEIAAMQQQMEQRSALAAGEQAAWERNVAAGNAQRPEPPSDVLALYRLDETDGTAVHDSSAGQRHGQVKGDPIWIPREIGSCLLFNGETFVQVDDFVGFERTESFSLGVWVYPTTNDTMSVLSRTEAADSRRGYELLLDGGKVAVNLVHHWDENAIVASAQTPLKQNKWQHVMLTYDGSSKAGGVRIYIDGQVQQLDVAHDTLSDTIGIAAPLQIGRRSPDSAFRGMMDELRQYSRELSAAEVALLAGGNPIGEIIALPVPQRSEQQAATLRRYYLENHDPAYKKLKVQIEALTARRKSVAGLVPTAMVMQELDSPRDTFLLAHGDYRNTTEKVTPGTPAVLPPLPADAPPNRLGLARWIVDPANPLTARVTVNHIWQMHFGTGLVSTADDFGTRGELPSHPELLDWLAVEFVRSGWDVKHMHKLIVMSETFRQSSRISRESWQHDPHNRWLARGPRGRLPAEFIRDGALAVSGLLDEQVGGNSVYPYQPPGLWEEVSYNPNEFTAQVYVPSHGRDLYRRSLYTFWKRTVPPPALAVFGAPDRETCTVVRTQSNTPLQSLVLLNDPTYVEAARSLAQRLLTEAGPRDEDRIAYGFRLVTGRRPQPAEVDVFREVFQTKLSDYHANLKAAIDLLSVGESVRNERLDAAEHAAWTIIAGMLLNLNESITSG